MKLLQIILLALVFAIAIVIVSIPIWAVYAVFKFTRDYINNYFKKGGQQDNRDH